MNKIGDIARTLASGMKCIDHEIYSVELSLSFVSIWPIFQSENTTNRWTKEEKVE